MSDEKISDLVPDPKNANKGTQRGLKALDDSLRNYGAGRSILIDRDNRIIAGNKTAERAADIGLDDVIIVETDGTKLVAVKRTDLDLEDDGGKARALATYDNRVGQLDLDWDIDQLQLLDDDLLGDLWSEKELADLGYDFGEPAEDPGAQIDRAEELREKWGVETGQLWQLGEHRLICGDCTERAVVERVIDNTRAAITFTSPPYNAGVSAKLRGNTSIDDNLYKDEYNDNQAQPDYLVLLNEFTKAAMLVSDYVFVNLQFLSGNKRAFVDYLTTFRDKLADIAIWDKKHAAPQQALRVMDSRFEFILIFSNDATRAIGTREFRGMVHNVYDGSPQRHNEYAANHAATFPVDFPEHFIKTFTNSGELCYEPFLGTGTTLIACERLGRKCRAIEISPAYCAVAIQRWVDMTGGEPVLVNT